MAQGHKNELMVRPDLSPERLPSPHLPPHLVTLFPVTAGSLLRGALAGPAVGLLNSVPCFENLFEPCLLQESDPDHLAPEGA